MTFLGLTEYLIGHPAFEDALNSHSQGDCRALKNILMDIQMHAYQQTASLASRVYGLNKWQNSADIKTLIRETPPPELDFTLPIPTHAMRIAKSKNKTKVEVRNQLSLFLQIA